MIRGSSPAQPRNERSMTTKRRSKRIKSVIPVRLRINGSKDGWLAHTVNVTNHGVQLGGFQGEIKVDDTIVIQYRHKQAQFRVTWIAVRTGSLEKQIGATAFPEQPEDYDKS